MVLKNIEHRYIPATEASNASVAGFLQAAMTGGILPSLILLKSSARHGREEEVRWRRKMRRNGK